MRRCPWCTAPLIAGRCPACDPRRWVRLIHREVVLAVVLVAVVAVTFLITRGMAEDHKRLQQHRAAYWYATAQDELRAGQGEAALTALRRAALRDPTNPQYRLALGAALVANGRDDEARRVFSPSATPTRRTRIRTCNWHIWRHAPVIPVRPAGTTRQQSPHCGGQDRWSAGASCGSS